MIEWFAKNPVAANFLLIVIVAAGVTVTSLSTPLEIFPSTELDQVNISVSQRAATPEDIETGITNRIEEAVADLPYIDELASRSAEQRATIFVQLDSGTDRQKALNEVKSRVDALSSLPSSAERPVVEIPIRKREVLSVVIYGELDEFEMSRIARRVRDDIVRVEGISQADIEGVRPYEIGIEIRQADLRAYNLTLDGVAEEINRQAFDLSAGQLRSAGGDVLLRTQQQAYGYEEFSQVVLRRFADGSALQLGDIADIKDGFDENPVITRFNGQRAAVVNVYRVGNESAISVSDAVRGYLATESGRYPSSVKIDIWDDDARIVRERLNTLLNSGWQGALLIGLLLTLFLHPSVAFWVVAGIPVCFAGALALFPSLDMTINVISLFSFIMVLGVVVDDAIVTGENIFTHRSRGSSGIDAAVEGTREISVPVVFGIVTTMIAFVPMLMLDGFLAIIGQNIGLVVIVVLAFSLVESKLILPAHLRKLQIQSHRPGSLMGRLEQVQQRVTLRLNWFLERVYQPVLQAALRRRYLTVVVFLCTFVIMLSLVSFGFVRFTFFPVVNSETARAAVTFPSGSPLSVTEAAIARLEGAVFDMREEYRQESGASLINNVISTVGQQGGGGAGASNRGRVQFEINQELINESEMSNQDLIREWRDRVGLIIGAEQLNFRAQLFRAGSPIEVEFYSNDSDQLADVIETMRGYLGELDGVFDIEDSMLDGKRELQIELKPEAQLLGLDLRTVTQQVRSAFFGAQAQRIQRGRDDVRVMVRYPIEQRRSIADLDNLLITTASGAEARFGDIASVEWGRSPTSIYHANQLRTATIEADADKKKVNLSVVVADVEEYVKNLLLSYPDVSYSMAGEAEEQKESNEILTLGLGIILLAIFGILAIAFKSYYQPLIIMSVIPFAMIGAIAGHFIIGKGLSIFSVFGMLALVGVVVNDSLVLVDWINRRVHSGERLSDLVQRAGRARFRAVLLTSLTTFFGLLPILFLTSTSSQFLIPMATSLGFGILFATFITLILVPCNYLILEDIRNLKRRLFSGDDKGNSGETEVQDARAAP